MVYTDAEIAAALVAPARRWSFRYERVTSTTTDLTVIDCSVAYNDLADGVQRTCAVRLPDGSPFNILTDRFRPWARLLMPDGGWQEWCLGTFYLSTDTRRKAVAAGAGTQPLQGWDSTQLTLQDDKITDRFVAAAGASVVGTVRTILTDHQMSLTAMPSSTVTLPGALEWEPGTTWRKIINDLLTSVNYRPLTSTPLGLPTTQAYVDPQTAGVLWAYRLDASSVVRRGIDVTLDLFNVPNRWVAYVSEPDRAPLRSVYTNATIGDPLSTVGRGRTIVDVLNPQNTQAVDQTTLDQLVLRAAQDARSAFERVEFSTGLMPIFSGGDVVTLDLGDGPARYRSHTWEIELRAGGDMRHEMRRVVAL